LKDGDGIYIHHDLVFAAGPEAAKGARESFGVHTCSLV
jgi:hypothetical protein